MAHDGVRLIGYCELCERARAELPPTNRPRLADLGLGDVQCPTCGRWVCRRYHFDAGTIRTRGECTDCASDDTLHWRRERAAVGASNLPRVSADAAAGARAAVRGVEEARR